MSIDGGAVARDQARQYARQVEKVTSIIPVEAMAKGDKAILALFLDPAIRALKAGEKKTPCQPPL